MCFSRLFLCSLFITCCVVDAVSAQQVRSLPEAAPVRFMRLTHDDGLAQQTVFSILQDRHGFMWFGLGEGLNRYDGYDFQHYQHDPNDANSLSTGIVEHLLEDRHGMIWIGHDGGGLSRFDPLTETFTHFRHDEDDPTSLSGDFIRSIYEDRRGTLWVGTWHGGLNRFDRETETFTHFQHDPDDPTSLSDSLVWSMYEDRQGAFWIGTGNGLNRFERSSDGEAGAFTRFMPESGPPWANWISAMYEDREGTLWVGGWGLYRFDREAGAFEHFLMESSAVEPQIWGVNRVGAIVEDPAGVLWVGCTGGWDNEGSLYRFDRTSGRFTPSLHDPNDPHSLDQNNVLSLYIDRQGILWVATLNGGGVSRVDRTIQPFTRYPMDQAGREGLRGVAAWSIYLDPDDVLWVGTPEGVLNRFDRQRGTVRYYELDPTNRAALHNDNITVIHGDQRGTLWLGSMEGGLRRFDEASGQFVTYRSDPREPTSISGNEVYLIAGDRAGHLWVGTHYGLDRYDPNIDGFIHYRQDPADSTSLADNWIGAIYEDHAGRLWIGTSGVLNLYDPRGETFQRMRFAPPDFKANYLYYLASTSQDAGALWIGVPTLGLFRFDIASRRVTHHYTAQNSDLPSNVIRTLLSDDQGRLWMSTQGGLARFDPVRERFEVFTAEDNLQTLVPHAFSAHKGHTGELFFGGSGGVNAIRPGAPRVNPYPPQVALTGLRLFNEPLPPGPQSPLDKSITVTDSIELRHDRNDLTVEYVGLHFKHPEGNRYAYRLEGYDDTWREVGTDRSATYTGLEPGPYTFQVKASNSDGVWSEEPRLLAITVLPPWWRTWWAYGLYGLLAAMGVLLVALMGRRHVLRKERERTIRHELEQARQIAAMNRQLRLHEAQLETQNSLLEVQQQRLLELDALKSRFFANVSHEFRTPLTLLLGPLDDFLSGRGGSNNLLRQAPLMQRNARRLLRLINQLLDLSRLEAGGVHLDAQPTDLDRLLRTLVQQFASRAERKGITLRYDGPASDPAGDPAGDPLTVLADRDKLEKVILNLLSNAFKFTACGGEVRVALRRAVAKEVPADEHEADGWAEILVEDTGQGISEDALPFLFDRFYQAETTSMRTHGGSGIGLALAKELVTLHGGEIAVESTEGVGTRFTVRLPVAGFEAPESRTLADSADRSPEPFDNRVMADLDSASSTEPEADGTDLLEATERPGAPTVLVVEDNADMRAYLRGLLVQDGYRVREAHDGREGLEAARSGIPELVISDVMMPYMDGVALCRAIKESEALNHVPVVLLTARAGEEDVLEGLGAGADAYLSKPFSAEELLLRTENLIEIRRRLRMRYSDEIVLGPGQVVVTSEEAAFVERVRAAVEAELSNSGFTIEQLADAVGISPRQLYRRLKTSLGLTPAGYVRMLRLARAAQLLAQGAGTVSEVAYAVGYNDAVHFSRLFRQAHGVSPSAYRREDDQRGKAPLR